MLLFTQDFKTKNIMGKRFFTFFLLATSSLYVSITTAQDTIPLQIPSLELDKETDSLIIDNKYKYNINNLPARRPRAGIIIVGNGATTRALNAFNGSCESGKNYANVVNTYKIALGDSVNVYCMAIPIAAEFYSPDTAKKWTNEQLPIINCIYENLLGTIKKVDVYMTLSKHIGENIYLRTDHHWAPLGAYYTAAEFAEIAKVPFKDLSNYERKVVKIFVGSMWHYSKDVAVKNAPEDFVYYVPQGVEFQTTYINYILNKYRRVVGERKPVDGPFFLQCADGSRGAYCTFMGGDPKTVKIQTSTKNGRKLLILKDSFGNALPSYLFYSFQEIHVIDFRYFRKKVVEYVHNNSITDVLFANNLTHACLASTWKAYYQILGK